MTSPAAELKCERHLPGPLYSRLSRHSTLRAYLESGFNLTKTAGILCVHPNTVVYRLRRIKEITARDPHNPNDLLLLCLGLKMFGLAQEG